MAFNCQPHICTDLSSRPAISFPARSLHCNFLSSSTALSQNCCHASASRLAPQAFRSGPYPSNRSARRAKLCRTKASGGGEGPQESSQTAMSPQEAYDLLGVKESSSFDQIMSAKNKLVSKAGNDQSRKTQVDLEIWLIIQQLSMPGNSV